MHQGAKAKIFRYAKLLRSNSTNTENLLWQELRNKKLGFKFRRQHPLGIYIVDFYCHEAKLVIEIDGAYHNNKDQKIYDQKRTNHIIASGLSEIRFSNKEIETDFDIVLQSIRLAINEKI